MLWRISGQIRSEVAEEERTLFVPSVNGILSFSDEEEITLIHM
jgi:preprotein translocase subunit Sec61beta